MTEASSSPKFQIFFLVLGPDLPRYHYCDRIQQNDLTPAEIDLVKCNIKNLLLGQNLSS